MIELVCSFLAVVVIHELGHILMVMLCNKIEKGRSLILWSRLIGSMWRSSMKRLAGRASI